MFKRLSCVFITFAIALSVMAGCASKDQKAVEDNTLTQATKVESTAGATEGNANSYGWVKPAETIEFTYFPSVFREDNTKEEAATLIDKYLLDEFNVKINMIVSETDRNERLSLMMASNDYPDAITDLSAAEVSQWAQQGKAIELTKLVDKYGPEFKTQLGDNFVRYLEKDGSYYGLPKAWGYCPIPDNGAALPYAKWVELGKPQMLTTEEYFNVMSDMQKENPKNANGQRTYALSGWDWGVELNYEILAGVWGIKKSYKEDAQGNLTHWMNTPEGLEMAKYINRYYREDMLDPDTFANNYDQFKEKFSNRRINGFIGPWWACWESGHEVWSTTDPNWKDEDRYVQIGLKAPGAETAYLSPKDSMGLRTIITDKAKNPEQIMTFLNWAITDLGQKLLAYGVPNTEGSLWTIDKDGNWGFVEEQKQKLITGKGDWWTGAIAAGADRYTLVNNIAPRADGTMWWWDQCFNNIGWKKVLNDNLKATVYDNTIQNIDIPVDDPTSMTERQVQQLIYTGWANIVQSDTEEICESRFLDLQKKVNAAGLHKVEEYRTKVYQERLKNWGK